MGKAKLNIPMCAALVLLFLTMLSIHLTSGLYARYTATSTASDSARVAKFAISGTENGTVAVSSHADSNEKYQMTVRNESEVAISYSLEFVFLEDVTDWLELTLEDGPSMKLKDSKKTIIFENVGELPPLSEVTHSVVFTVKDGQWSYVTVDATDPTEESVSKDMTFIVNIHATQID